MVLLSTLFLVDSNLKYLHIGAPYIYKKSKTIISCNTLYLRCNGDVKVVYVVNEKDKDWPKIESLSKYTDVVIALGINHAKFNRHGSIKASKELAAIVDRYRLSFPSLRIHIVPSLPSLNEETTRCSEIFNDTFVNSIKADVHIVNLPRELKITSGAKKGCLNEQFARENEKRHRRQRSAT